jgi:aspartate/methionine/tyrosine aminotransferase
VGENAVHIEQASPEQLAALAESLAAEYQALHSQALNLDLTRGKPCTEQVALSDALDGILAGDFKDAHGVDVRNYGGLSGLQEARELFAAVLGSDPDNTLAGGNSSLTLMYQVLDFAMNKGLSGTPWRDSGQVKFLCPVPGYDRHFSVCEHLGMELVPVAMTGHGPDMDRVESLVKSDPAIKGIWCVPRFSNPTGETCSPQTVERLARLGQIASPDFIVMWDNAYAMHSLSQDAEQLANINDYCAEHGTANSVFQFGSTSKVTFAGAGVAFLASGQRNIKALTKHLGFSAIGPDKVNQLRHVRFLKNMDGLRAHMAKHTAIIKPRFDCVLEQLEQELADSGMASWTQPKGGYFISFDSRPGLAETIVAMAAAIGVKLTPAGATYPYGDDPLDCNIRLAPTYASLEEVQAAISAFVVCVKLASVRQLV